MANLVLVHGPGARKEYALAEGPLVIGRQPGVAIRLDLHDVSRQHARISREQGRYFVEDLGSSNGTCLNGLPLQGKAELRAQDQITIGPFQFLFEEPPASAAEAPRDSETGVVISAVLSARTSNADLFSEDAGSKLQAVLEIANQLAQSLDLDALLPRLLDHLLGLFRKADRGLVLLCHGDQLVVRATRARRPDLLRDQAYSRSVTRRVLQEGVGIVASDWGSAAPAESLAAAGIRSFVCVPLKGRDGRPLGVLQLDRSGRGGEFTREDLHLLTAVSLQVSVVLENTALHASLLEHERIKRDLALARLSQMVAGVAHEINNPLAFVSNNTAIFERDMNALRKLLCLYQDAEPALAGACPEKLQPIREFAENIDLPYTLQHLDDLLARSRHGLKRIQGIVQSLRDFARLDQSELDEVDLNAGVESTVNITRGVADKQGVELVLDLTPLPRLVCHPSKINQVVFHLLANAVGACASGGKVTVQTRAGADAVEIHVLDTGCGIEPAIRDKIFDPFFTTKELGKGAGLGLSISYGIVQDHGGTIEVQSAVAQGAHFTVRLPLKRSQDAARVT